MDIKTLNKFVWYVNERETIRQKVESGAPAPWTENTILQRYSFTNINRNWDKDSKIIADIIKENSKYWTVNSLINFIMMFRIFQSPKRMHEYITNLMEEHFNNPFYKFFEDEEFIQTMTEGQWDELIQINESNYSKNPIVWKRNTWIFNFQQDVDLFDDYEQAIDNRLGCGVFFKVQTILDIRAIRNALKEGHLDWNKEVIALVDRSLWNRSVKEYSAHGSKQGLSWIVLGKNDFEENGFDNSPENVAIETDNVIEYTRANLTDEKVKQAFEDSLNQEPYNIKNMFCEFNKFMLLTDHYEKTGKLKMSKQYRKVGQEF